MAGGLDSFDWLKDRIKKPKALVDLSGIEELRGVRSTSDGIEIGAMLIEVNPEITPLTGYVRHSFHRPAGVVLPALIRAAWP